MYVDKTLFAGYEAYSFVIVGIHNEFIIKNSVRPRIQQRQPISLPTRGETKTALYISWLRSKIINLVGPVKGKRQSFYFVLYLVLGLDCCCVSSGTNKDFTEALFWLRIKLLYVGIWSGKKPKKQSLLSGIGKPFSMYSTLWSNQSFIGRYLQGALKCLVNLKGVLL